MRLVMALLVRDERDIILENIQFHLGQGVDEIVVVDNGSIDGTRDILSDCQKNLPIHVFDEPGRDYSQSKWMTKAAIFARDYLKADWIFCNDADEFWRPSGAGLKAEIQAAGAASQITFQRRNMVFAPDAPSPQRWADRLIYRVAKPVAIPVREDNYEDKLPAPYFYLNLPPKVMFRAADFQSVGMGNHTAETKDIAATHDASGVIYHYPIRSVAHFERKVSQGGAAYANNAELPEGIGWHWRRWYRMLQNSEADRALRDALPDQARLQRDLRSGVIIKDQSMTAQI